MPTWSGRETADITYNDESGVLTGILIDNGYLSAETWTGARVDYLIEVKTTTGPCRMPFFMSKHQYRRVSALCLNRLVLLSADMRLDARTLCPERRSPDEEPLRCVSCIQSWERLCWCTSAGRSGEHAAARGARLHSRNMDRGHGSIGIVSLKEVNSEQIVKYLFVIDAKSIKFDQKRQHVSVLPRRILQHGSGHSDAFPALRERCSRRHKYTLLSWQVNVVTQGTEVRQPGNGSLRNG